MRTVCLRGIINILNSFRQNLLTSPAEARAAELSIKLVPGVTISLVDEETPPPSWYIASRLVSTYIFNDVSPSVVRIYTAMVPDNDKLVVSPDRTIDLSSLEMFTDLVTNISLPIEAVGRIPWALDCNMVVTGSWVTASVSAIFRDPPIPPPDTVYH